MATARPNWHENAFFGIHYDQHAGAKDTVLGAELTHEHLRERLLRVKPDWIHCDCKGHPGYTSWPTEVGSTSPGMVKDQLRIYRDVTRELGVRLGMHYSGVWDSRAIELHPDWARIDPNGKPDPNATCRLSGYADILMIPQMIEIIDKYDVDSFWVDGENWASKPCWCERCKAEFARRTGPADIPAAAGQPNWNAWLAFHRDLFVEHVTKYADAVHARKPTCMVCSNWMYTVRQPDAMTAPVDYLSGDYDWSWGSDRAAIEGRVLDGRSLPWDLMAWGFTKTAAMHENPPWVMKTATHLCQELAEVVALGGGAMVYNTPQRTGWLTGWQQDIIGQVADFCRARKDACFRSKSVPQAAVLHLASHFYSCNDPLFNYGPAAQPLEGALHALLEAHISTDVLTEDAAQARMHPYKLVVVPEQTRLSAAMTEALETFARSGGQVILSGAHLARDYPALVGASPAGEPVTGASYLPVDDCAVGVSGPWQPVTPAGGTEPLVCRLSQQEAAKDATTQAVVTRRPTGEGAIIAVHGPVFRDYFLGHYPMLRRFINSLIAGLGVEWMVTLDASPRLELVLRQKAGRLLINLINRGAGETLGPQRVIVEELPPVQNVLLRIRREGRPQSITLVPAETPLEWSYARGQVVVKVPSVAIHSVVVVE